MYAKYFKRVIDFCLSMAGLIVLSPALLVLTVLGTVFMGGSPFFIQERPGRDEKIFKLIKFRTMDNRRDKDGKLLPDEARLNKYGRFLRSTSLDELPELINIIKGDMAIVGPRPQLVRDMVFMTDEQRRRHTVRQGLTGLAQINGRNAISWEDVRIILQTVVKAFVRQEGITDGDMATAYDYGDWLLKNGKVDRKEYDLKQKLAIQIINGKESLE